jgi:hypothetical protein
MRLIPADAAQLDDLFQAFCEGAERNPDWSGEHPLLPLYPLCHAVACMPGRCGKAWLLPWL